ncbi:MAG: hypothetical protein N2Z72_01670 [Bacteroidales bacterium]|nr:hypothetical protein [Bacteroidales bacterium]
MKPEKTNNRIEKLELILLQRPLVVSVSPEHVSDVKNIASSIEQTLIGLQKKYPRKDLFEIALLMLIDVLLEKHKSELSRKKEEDQLKEYLHRLYKETQKSLYSFSKKNI